MTETSQPATATTRTDDPLAPAPVAATPVRHRAKVSWAFADAFTVAWRNLLRYVRVPQLIVFSTIQPIMFVLLFRYVFGGAIPTGNPAIPYVVFLMPGIFVQTVLFGSTSTGIGLAEDADTGLLERFRSLPMARSAVLTGRTLADVVRNCFVVILMVVVGYIVGFRFQGNIFESGLALVLVVLFGYAFSWIAAMVGLRSSTAEAAQAALFPILFPLVFASSAFVPTETMPSWLQAFANHQPVSAVINAVRELVYGPLNPPGTNVAADVGIAVAWMVAITAVFAPLAVRAYRKKVS
jgi:ABC-2 type transport system permease protein/oleandomycin transport system permease protein